MKSMVKMKSNHINKILNFNCIDGLKQLPDKSVNCCVTSPPYYGLRDYGTANWVGGDVKCKHVRQNKKSNRTITGHSNFDKMNGVGDAIQKNICSYCGALRVDDQLGLEETPYLYVKKLVKVFREVRRVLKDDGTLWLNLGDSYAGSGKGSNKDGSVHISSLKGKQGTSKGTTEGIKPPQKAKKIGLKPKDLIGIPWMVAFALQADGWYLRQDIIWHKPNPMPESVTDRCTKSHEYIFLLSKKQRYYYDHEAIKEDAHTTDESNRNRDETKLNNTPGRTRMSGLKTNHYETKNKRSVWTVSTKPYSGAHFATFPQDLISPCIKAGCVEDGIVLDPFMGSGTTAIVARKLYRNFIGFELNPEYIKIAEERIENELGFFK